MARASRLVPAGAVTRYLNRIMANQKAEEGLHGVAELLSKRFGRRKFADPEIGQTLKTALREYSAARGTREAEIRFSEALANISQMETQRRAQRLAPEIFRRRPRSLIDFNTSRMRVWAAAQTGRMPNRAVAGALNVLGTGGFGQFAASVADFYTGFGWGTGIARGLATYAALDTVSRITGGGTLFRDRQGSFDIVGVPLL